MMTKRAFLTKFLTFLAGIYIGLTLPNLFGKVLVYRKQCLVAESNNKARANKVGAYDSPKPRRTLSQEFHTKQLLFVGVMTTEKFRNSRATVVYNTWGKSVPGKVVFFSGNETGDVRQLPLVSLSGVDDSYPPQHKSLMMLKYMHDHYIDQFEYFMRSDDDLYIRNDELEEFLRGFDSSQDLFIGQAGVGAKGETGLGLGSKDNFCMGGTGVIMSRSVLKKLAPHLEYCFKNMVSGHEDVEVGRCVKNHVGVSCTWAYEMQWLFYHNQSKTNAFHWDLDTKAVQNAITFHPVKDPKYMYRIHTHFLAKKIQALQHMSVTKATLLWRLTEELRERKVLAKRVAKLKEKKDLYLNVPSNSTLHWEFFDPKLLFTTISPPRVKIIDSLRKSLNEILRNSFSLINQEARKVIFRELVLSKVNLGYIRISPTHGTQYLLDLRMNTYQHLGYSRRKLPLNVHYQAHMQQLFGNLVYTSSVIPITKPYIHVVLSLAGRLRAFATFLSNFEKVVLLNYEKVKLLIMYFPDVAPYSNHKKILRIYQEHYPSFNVVWKTIPGPFSRALALQLGSTYATAESLLFFCDVDLRFDVEFLQRCRQHSIHGKQVYYPMVFSQFNQSLGNVNKSSSSLHGEKGFWRKYGFGILCAYSGDVAMVGGFDTKIRGWGMEDVKLYEQFISSGRYTVFRAPDPGLIHIHHTSECSTDLEPSRLQMCNDSRMSQLASSRSLVDHMAKKGYL